MTNSQSNLNSEQHIADILPLVELPERKVPSSERTTFKLNTNPAEAASPKMDFNVNHLTGTETTREVITFVARVRELKVGLGITDDERMAQFHTTVLTLLHGSAKEAYEVAAKEAATERREELAEQQTETWYLTHAEPTVAVRAAKKKTYLDEIPEFIEEDFEVGLTAICDQLLPFQALIKVKRYLRRHCHKPANMTIRQYVSRIRKINEHELPLLVPMSPDNQLPFDEVKELLFYGIPNRYRKKLQEMDVDMTNCPDYATFIQRAERVEEAERMDSNSNTSASASVPKKNKSSKSSNGKGKSYIRNEDSPSGNGTKNCIYHGMNNTHSTDECKVMQAMAESKKSSSGNTTNSSSYADKKKNNGKSYDKSVTKKEINALVAKTVRKELMAVSAARKKATREANNVEIVADDPLAAELALDEELAGYDFSLLKEENGMKVDTTTSEDVDE